MTASITVFCNVWEAIFTWLQDSSLAIGGIIQHVVKFWMKIVALR